MLRTGRLRHLYTHAHSNRDQQLVIRSSVGDDRERITRRRGLGGGRRRCARGEGLVEARRQDGEVGQIHSAVVVEVALAERLARAVEVGGQGGEVGQVHCSVVVGVGGEDEEVEEVVG